MMTIEKTATENPTDHSASRPILLLSAILLLIISTFTLVGHGCHGPDEDHEPVVISRNDDTR